MALLECCKKLHDFWAGFNLNYACTIIRGRFLGLLWCLLLRHLSDLKDGESMNRTLIENSLPIKNIGKLWFIKKNKSVSYLIGVVNKTVHEISCLSCLKLCEIMISKKKSSLRTNRDISKSPTYHMTESFSYSLTNYTYH